METPTLHNRTSWPLSQCDNVAYVKHCGTQNGEGLLTCLTTGCAWSTADHLLPGYLGNLHACIDRTAFLPNCTEAMMPVWSNFAGVE